jgi:hypothetical protein
MSERAVTPSCASTWSRRTTTTSTPRSTFAYPRYEIIPTGDVFDGEQEVRRYYAESRPAFPDQRNELIALHHIDDGVVVEFAFHGTHLGRLGSLAPTGRAFRCRMTAFFIFDDDRVPARVLRPGDGHSRVGAPTGDAEPSTETNIRLGSNLGSKVRASRPELAGRKPNTHGPCGSRAPRSLRLRAGWPPVQIRPPGLRKVLETRWFHYGSAPQAKCTCGPISPRQLAHCGSTTP